MKKHFEKSCHTRPVVKSINLNVALHAKGTVASEASGVLTIDHPRFFKDSDLAGFPDTRRPAQHKM